MRQRATGDHLTDETARFRTVVLDWMVEVADSEDMSLETIFLAKNYLDRAMAVRPRDKKFIQLLGITCLMVAGKITDRDPLSVRECARLCDGLYHRAQVIECELTLLRDLSTDLCVACEPVFLDRLVALALPPGFASRARVVHLAQYALALTIGDRRCTAHAPSLIAACALSSALAAHARDPWPPSVTGAVGADPADPATRACAAIVRGILEDAADGPSSAVKVMFGKRKHGAVAKDRFPPPRPKD